ncbi:MAG: RNB domain-containing ribonuclease [Zoogloeaceae bacterium]|jgi:exoribonuclease-2|nr:RNB domain-containing ribonuclease [Zoogloeaceae bacterium]
MNENLLFEEGGSFRAGSILMDNETSLQVELPGGKRSKIKASQILLRFQSPAPGQILKEAEPLAADIDVAFLWEIAGEGEFAFLDLAEDYYGHAPAAPEAASLLLALHGAPVYFQRKGKGHFRKTPADTLRAALAGIEKKRQQALAIEGWVQDLIAGRLPAELAPHAASLLARPDRNRPEIKAFETAAGALSCSMPELLLRAGALKSSHDVHLQRFLAEQFPRGTGFPPFDLPVLPDDLPNANVRAFSIDDASTTEVDDAFSLTALPDGGWRIGIHIAAPGLALAHGDALAAIARARLSTVYMPGQKITMLPEAAVGVCTLAEGRACPAVSLYLQVDAAQNIAAHASCIERVHIAANLRHHEIEPWFNETSVHGALPNKPFCEELLFLWRFACAAEARRGKPAATQGVNDYNFEITGDLLDAENCRVRISARKRGSPLDKLVAELMIIANTIWGGLLAERGIAALYRAQTGGKARMTTAPQPHEGLGAPQYAWMTSPLRRYCDLVNQWQLIAALQGTPPPFAPRSAELFAALRDFELTYAAYAEFQRRMERYWCLRHLAQESIAAAVAVVRRDDLARFETLPLFVRLPGASHFPSGQRLKVAIDHLDFLALEAHCHIVEAMDAQDAQSLAEDDDEALPPEEMAPENPAVPSACSIAPTVTESSPV